MNLNYAIQARLTDAVQLTYRTPAKLVRELLPDGLELIMRGPWAFWSVQACRVEKARPFGTPRVCGASYHQITYRLAVQAMTDRAEVVQGWLHTHSTIEAGVFTSLNQLLGDSKMPTPITLDATDCGLRYVAGERAKQVDTAGSQANSNVSDMALASGLPLNELAALRHDPTQAKPSAQTDFDLVVAHAPGRLTPGSCFPTKQDAELFGRGLTQELAHVTRKGEHHLRITRLEQQSKARSQTPLIVHRARMGYFDMIGQSEYVELEWASRLGPAEVQWQHKPLHRLLLQPQKVDTPQLIPQDEPALT